MTPAASGAPATLLLAPSLARRMASFVYEGLLLFGIGLIPGAIGALFVALSGHRHPLQSDTALQIITPKGPKRAMERPSTAPPMDQTVSAPHGVIDRSVIADRNALR